MREAWEWVGAGVVLVAGALVVVLTSDGPIKAIRAAGRAAELTDPVSRFIWWVETRRRAEFGRYYLPPELADYPGATAGELELALGWLSDAATAAEYGIEGFDNPPRD